MVEEKVQERLDEAVDKRIEEKLSRGSTGKEESTGKISRREFLKKTGLGAAGFSALALLPSASAFDIKTGNPLQYFNGSRDSNPNFQIDTSGDITGEDADVVELVADRVKADNELRFPSTKNTSNDNQIWSENGRVKVQVKGTTRTIASAIPDSVVSRTDDNGSTSTDVPRGLNISTNVEWPKINGRISANVSGVSQASIYRTSDEQLMRSTDISSLSAGDVFTIDLDINLVSGENYNFVLGANGSTYTQGFNDSVSFPINSSDGDLTIEAEADGKSGTGPNASNIVELGNINLS